MSGETQDQPSGWTPDLLFLHLQSEVDGVNGALTQEIITVRASFGRQLDSQKELFQSQLSNLREMLNERYATQTKALDAAFLAQQAAMTTAFSAAEKAVQAALLAAEKAVDKANTASEKRFEAVNEFRGQLGDMQTTLMTRSEADAKFKALEDRVTDVKTIQDKGFAGQDGRHAGGKDSWGYLVGAVGMLAVMVTIALALIGR